MTVFTIKMITLRSAVDVLTLIIVSSKLPPAVK